MLDLFDEISVSLCVCRSFPHVVPARPVCFVVAHITEKFHGE